MKNKLMILIGLPCSGKSTFAKDMLNDNENVIHLSSDSIRVELFGFEDQSHNGEVFQTMNTRCKESLKNGYDVIYDATNINKKRRKSLINEMKKYCGSIELICFFCNFDELRIRNIRRKERTVPEDKMLMMLKNFQIPKLDEGADMVFFYTTTSDLKGVPKINIQKIFEKDTDVETCYKMVLEGISEHLYEYDQHNIHHTETLGNHIKTVIEKCYEYSRDGFSDIERKILLVSAFYHDMGKPYCQTFKENGTANYIQHNLVSTYIFNTDYMSCHYSIGGNYLGVISDLVELHDFIFSYKDLESAKEKLIEKVGERVWEMLLVLNNADRFRP